MNFKKSISLIFGLLAIQVFVPSYNATEVTPNPTEQSAVSYARTNPTPAQVRAAAPTDLVVFADETLEALIAKHLNVPVGTITVEDMASLNRLGSYFSNVSNISGLEYAVNLSSIILVKGTITDLSPLRDLNKLITLFMGNNNISDISPLANLTQLRAVQLENNKIVDISPLRNLTQLRLVELENNKIVDMSSLSNKTYLFHLGLVNNEITELPSLVASTSLTDLFLSNNHISNVAPLSSMPSLLSLSLSNNDITDLSTLTNLTQLQELAISNLKIKNIEPLAEFKSLERLDASKNEISDVSPLGNLTNLGELHLDDNKIANVLPLNNLKNLYSLNLTGNMITDITQLNDLFSFHYTFLSPTISDQIINLPDINVSSDEEIFFDITGPDGETIPVSLGTPTLGTNNLSGTTDFMFFEYYPYSITINQKVNYSNLTGLKNASSSLGVKLENEQLIVLFEVVSASNSTITADDSAVDYNTPGTYDVIFTDDIATYTASLTIAVADNPIIDLPTDNTTSEVTENENTTSEVAVNENNVDVNSEVQSESTTPMTDNQKNKLTTTGAKTSLIIITLAAVATLLFLLKKRIENLK